MPKSKKGNTGELERRRLMFQVKILRPELEEERAKYKIVKLFYDVYGQSDRGFGSADDHFMP